MVPQANLNEACVFSGFTCCFHFFLANNLSSIPIFNILSNAVVRVNAQLGLYTVHI